MTLARQIQLEALTVTINAAQGFARTLAQPDLVANHGQRVADWVGRQLGDCLARAARINCAIILEGGT